MKPSMFAPAQAARDQSPTCVVVSSGGDPGHILIQEAILDLISRSTLASWKVRVVDKHLAWNAGGDADLRGIIAEADAVVLAMGPIYWPYVERSDWGDAVVHGIKAARKRGAEVAIIAAGSCVSSLNTPDPVNSMRREERTFLEDLLGECSLITTRDLPMQKVIESLGFHSSLMPCVAVVGFSATIPLGPEPHCVGLNFMRGAGHHDYDSTVDGRRWTSTFEGFKRNAGPWDYLHLAHSPTEAELAAIVSPSIPVRRIRGGSDFVQFAGRMRSALVSRVHGSIGLAAVGVPSICVGSDSRVESVRELGLPGFHVGRVDAQELVGVINDFDEVFRNRVIGRVQHAKLMYQDIFSRWAEGVR